MIEVKPNLSQQSHCPYCEAPLKNLNSLWLGMRVCAESECPACCAKITEDLRIVYALTFPCQVDLEQHTVFCSEVSRAWFGQPLLQALENPQDVKVEISKEIFADHQNVIVLNCIDFLFGHALHRLLTAQKHLEHHSEYGLIVIVQDFLRWMVPEGVAEIWTVNIPLKKGTDYYPTFNQLIQTELKRFEKVYISEASPDPKYFDITQFTKVAKHNFDADSDKITFIWREDRIWSNLLLSRILKKLRLKKLLLVYQKHRVVSLFRKLKVLIPSAQFAVAGLGTTTQFPQWIEDYRVSRFDEKTERVSCKLYAESRLVIGVHGSNMLLPSAHAGMTLDLMLNGKENRWGNLTHDVLYQEKDARLAAFRYQYASFEVSLNELAQIAANMVLKFAEFRQMVNAGSRID